MISTLYYPNIVGGAEKTTQLLAEELLKNNLSVAVISSAKQRSVGKVNGIKVYYIPLKNLYWPFSKQQRPGWQRTLWHMIDSYNPFMAREVGKIVDQERPDLVHTHTLTGFSVATWKAVKKRGLPLVHTIQDYYLLCPRSNMFRGGANCVKSCRACSLFSQPKQGLSALVDHVVPVSKFVQDRHSGTHYFNGAGSSVIPNPAPACREPVKSPSRGALTCGFLGQLTPNKGIEDLLREFAPIEPGAAALLVAGTGKDDYVNFLRQTYGRPNIQFLGFVPPRKLFDQIDVLIVPSLWHDPCPLVILEAYSFGIPVIAARRGGIPEEVEEGKTGFLFEPSQPGELRRQIANFIHHPDLAAAMADHCWATAREFSLAQVCDRYQAVYRGLLG